jgi:hypothetical protein
MTRIFEHATAALAALLIMTATFYPIVTVPAADVSAAGPVLA